MRASIRPGARQGAWDLPAVLLTLAGTAERLGGALALHWTDFDLTSPGEIAWVRVGEWTVTRQKGVGIVRTRHGQTKEGERDVALPVWLSDHYRARYAARWHDTIVLPNPLQRDEYRDVSHVGKLLRRLLDPLQDDQGASMRWVSSHTLRRTLVTTAHDAGFTDRQIAGQTGHHSLAVLREYIGRARVSTVAAEVLAVDPRERAESA